MTERDQPITAVVWDYDGTLVNTRSSDEAAVADLLRADPSAAAGVDAFWSTEGRPIQERLELAWPGRGADVLALFDREQRPQVYPGVRRTLEKLRERGTGQAVVSSRRLGPLERGLRSCGLAAFFEVIVGLDSVLAPKPDPEGLLLALRSLQAPPQRAIYVGDRDVDLEAGRRAAMTVWHAVWSHPPALVEPSTHPIALTRPQQVLELIDGLGGRSAA